MTRIKFSLLLLSLTAWILMLTACGGGGGDGDSSSGTPPSSTNSVTIRGNAVKGPVSGATIAAFAINADGAPGEMIGSTQTDGSGNFSMTLNRASGPLMIQMSGGSYMDEATGTNMTMLANDVMTSAIPSISGSTLAGVQITPLTSMAQSLAAHTPGGMNAENITRANAAVGQYFGVGDILMIHPMDPMVNGSGARATEDMKNYGMSIAAMSQYARDIGMPYSSGMVTAMMNDATDGRMDGIMENTGMASGMMGSNYVQMGGGMMEGTMMSADAGGPGLAYAMSEFLQSNMNHSGLGTEDMQSLMNKLMSTNGQIR